MKKRWIFLLAVMIALLSCPPQWYPMPIRLKLTEWFGASGYRALPSSLQSASSDPKPFCPPDPAGWRDQQSIEGVDIGLSAACVADNPYAVAAFSISWPVSFFIKHPKEPIPLWCGVI